MASAAYCGINGNFSFIYFSNSNEAPGTIYIKLHRSIYADKSVSMSLAKLEIRTYGSIVPAHP
jgi:hypothetical protein